jgi:hypothetical protein
MLLIGLIINKLCMMQFLPSTKKTSYSISICYQTVVVWHWNKGR